MPSCRKALDMLNIETGENASLVMARYIKNLDDKNESKRHFFDAITDIASNSNDLYGQAFRMRHDSLVTIATPETFKTTQPLVVGLGNSNVIETGLALNHLYGVPIIPGSSIKGITAHYCAEVFGAEDPDYRGYDPDDAKRPAGKIYEALFGKTTPEDEQEAGLLRFYDAWIVPECVKECFVMDVMTPHHKSDFADPTPINFLTVSGKFEIFIGCNNFEADREWVDFAFSLTEAALSNYGIGGKIRAGYGKMERVLSSEEVKSRAEKQARAENMKAGFMYSVGDILEVVCKKVKIVKGKEKLEFAFSEDTGDKNAIRFEAIPKLNVGESIKAKIIRVERYNKAYIFQAV